MHQELLTSHRCRVLTCVSGTYKIFGTVKNRIRFRIKLVVETVSFCGSLCIGRLLQVNFV